LRRLDRRCLTRARELKGDDLDAFKEEHTIERESIREQFETVMSTRLVMKARQYHLATPPIPVGNDEGDESWEDGPVSDTYYLRATATAALHRAIEDSQARRRAAWESRAKIAGAFLQTYITTGSIIVAMFALLRR
jgi:hypothetical protein